MKRKFEYTHKDALKEFINTPKLKKDYEKTLQELRVAHQIIELREKRCMTQKQLAEKLHTKQQVISRIEKHNYIPSLTTLEKIARVFHKKLEIKFV